MKKFALGIFAVLVLSLAWKDGVNDSVLPDHFPEPNYSFEDNPLTTSGIQLGRELFYDPGLSRNETISCASCHSPYNAFAHTDHELSHGIEDRMGTRNAPGLFNLAWHETFMWDGAVHHLDFQALSPISDSTEMDAKLPNVIRKLNGQEKYKQLFFQSFGDSIATSERMLKALSQFLLTLVSSSSKYDRVLLGKIALTNQEQVGFELYKASCSPCHSEPLFTSKNLERNLLEVDTFLNDYGRQNITKDPSDSLLFKVPSLRNLSYTFPYMHDGRFRRLNDVINHYNEVGILTTQEGDTINIALSSIEKIDLKAFLLTLNDSIFVFNSAHHHPKAKKY